MLKGLKSASTAAVRIQAASTSEPPTPARPLLTISPCWRAHELVLDANDVSSDWRIFPVPTSLGQRHEAAALAGQQPGDPAGGLVEPRPAGGTGDVGDRPGPVGAIHLHRAALGGVQHGGDERLLVGAAR